jgi:sigma-B regulation protein RsbU (phosphoserine phosphatase)
VVEGNRADGSAAAAPAVRHVLVVDDSRMQRRIVSSSLQRLGYSVIEAASGEEALAIAAREPVDLVVSDWVMPGMSGLAFCRAFRDLPRDSYGYFILLTSKSEKEEIALGLDAGADDFLTKPVNADELRARLVAGERILRMERALKEKNRLLSATLAELQSLYDSLDRDLVEARRLQQSLIRDRHRRFDGAEVTLMLRPSGHVGGDLVGFFPIGTDRLAAYSIDVSGHGVTSALLTARLSGLLTGDTPERNIALVRTSRGEIDALPPDAVAARLNSLLLKEMHIEQYLTLAYAEVDLATGRVRMVQAGHPHPALQRADGRVEFVGNGGLPVGLLPEAEFETVCLCLSPGDRLVLYSDGITECPGRDGAELGEQGLADMLSRSGRLSGPAFLEALIWDLEAHSGGREFRDDLSAAVMTFTGRDGIR